MADQSKKASEAPSTKAPNQAPRHQTKPRTKAPNNRCKKLHRKVTKVKKLKKNKK